MSSTKTIDFRETVPAVRGVEVRKPCPITGFVSNIIIHWPPGCNALVQVAVVQLIEGKQSGIIPTDSGTFLALDDATPIFNVHFPVERGDYFMVIIRNTDSVNPHTISVDIVVNPAPIPTTLLPRRA